MDESRLQTISQLSAFLTGTLEVLLNVPDTDDGATPTSSRSLSGSDMRGSIAPTKA